jgi:hypothetical protein
MSKRKHHMNMTRITFISQRLKERERELEGPPLESEEFVAPIKFNKVNIGTERESKNGKHWRLLG